MVVEVGQNKIGTAFELPEHALPPGLDLTSLWLPTLKPQETCQ